MCFVNYISHKEYEERYAGKCPSCEGAVDSEGDTIEMDDCSYSPRICDVCGYCPCDLSC